MRQLYFKKSGLMLLLLISAISMPVYAVNPVYTNLQGQAIRGYDPVAYFTEGKPVEGRAEFSYEWHDATWRFASQQHLDAFKSNPEKYAPQYGGYCAYAVAKGATASIDPNAWHIRDGKLYLNNSLEVQSLWEQDIPGYITSANKNWPGIIGK